MGLSSLKLGQMAGLFWTLWWNFWFHARRGMSWISERLIVGFSNVANSCDCAKLCNLKSDSFVTILQGLQYLDNRAANSRMSAKLRNVKPFRIYKKFQDFCKNFLFFRIFGVLLRRNVESLRIYKKFNEICSFSGNFRSFSKFRKILKIFEIFGENANSWKLL